MSSSNRIRPTRALAIVATLLIASTFAWAGGPRLVVHIDEPFVIDGDVYPAGPLSLKTIRNYTPTSTLNEVRVGDRCLGMLIAKRSDDPSLEASRNAVMFVRDDDGRLVLRGFAYRTGRDESYRYELLVPRKQRRDARRSRVAASAPATTAEPVILAARLSR